MQLSVELVGNAVRMVTSFTGEDASQCLPPSVRTPLPRVPSTEEIKVSFVPTMFHGVLGGDSPSYFRQTRV